VTQLGIDTFGESYAGGHAYGQLIERLRGLIDAAAATGASDADVEAAAALVDDLTQLLRPAVPAGTLFPAGHRFDLPARGHPLLVPLRVDVLTEEVMRGSLRFTSAHVGHPGLAHGGFVALVFDEAFGAFAVQGKPPYRTATMTISYRAGTPVDVNLAIQVRKVDHDGRKLRVAALIQHGATVTAEAEALFIQPRATALQNEAKTTSSRPATPSVEPGPNGGQ
jgi:acyl-coenzyme A thioesterase PaaI-like protein